MAGLSLRAVSSGNGMQTDNKTFQRQGVARNPNTCYGLSSKRFQLLWSFLSVAVMMTTIPGKAAAFGTRSVMGRSNKLSFVSPNTFRGSTTYNGDGSSSSSGSSTSTMVQDVNRGDNFTFLDETEADSVGVPTDELLSKRVPVVIRYSADSGMKPYFLTVAKKLKEVHPDIILDKVILPKVETNNEGASPIAPTFEVVVDGKVVIPTVAKKDREGMGGHIVFVSMQELDAAIARARRRRRPSTVYGEDEANVRLEMLKVRAAAAAAASLANGGVNGSDARPSQNGSKLSVD